MIEILKKFLGKQEAGNDQWNQEQREALIDLLLVGMYADNMLSLAEDQFLHSEFDGLTWESGISCGAYVDNAIHKVRDALTDSEKREALLVTISTRLGDYDAKQRAMSALDNLFSVDGTVKKEHALRDEVQKVLGI
jgi:hypothetical protein